MKFKICPGDDDLKNTPIIEFEWEGTTQELIEELREGNRKLKQSLYSFALETESPYARWMKKRLDPETPPLERLSPLQRVRLISVLMRRQGADKI